MDFHELGIADELVAALLKRNITEPTPIQVAAYPVLRDGRSAYLTAETGTGKTFAYLLPLFARMDRKLEATQVAIVAPTHELAIQIQREAAELAQLAGYPLRVLLLIGGTAMGRQLEKLKKKPHIVVGSPGRVADLITMGKLKTHQLKALVIDEADRLMEAETLDALKAIIKASPQKRQLVFASATERPEATAVIATFDPNVEPIRAAAQAVSPTIEHFYLVCEKRDKPDLVRKLFHACKPDRAMVFVHTVETAEVVTLKLDHHHVPVVNLHSVATRDERKQAMDAFRAGDAKVMICSDVAARGLDLKGVTHIFNMDPPTESKAYLHRVGRTGRAGARGTAITLITEPDLRLVKRYQQELGITLARVTLREGRLIVDG